MSDQQKLYVGLAKAKVNKFGEKEVNVGFQQKDLDLLQSKLNGKGWVNVTVKSSKEGKPYLQIDTWVPKETQSSSTPAGVGGNEPDNDDLPF